MTVNRLQRRFDEAIEGQNWHSSGIQGKSKII